jgi:hypothetical protein
MKHELKIISEGTSATTRIYIDNKILGAVQEILISIDEVKIVFPDVRDVAFLTESMKEMFDNIDLIKEYFPRIKIRFRELK